MAKNEIDMTQGPLLPKILLFALPLMASSTLQLLFNAADMIVVGRYAGPEALAAVGANGSLITLFVNVFIGLSIGSNVMAAKYIGAGKQEELDETVTTSILLAILGGIFLMIVGALALGPMLIIMGTPAGILELAKLYLIIYFMGMPFNLLYNFGSALLRAVGDTRRPLIYLFISGVINIILNLVLVLGFNMSVAGVAIATVISQVVSAVLVIRCIAVSDGMLRLKFGKIRLNKVILKEIIKVGLPAGLQGVIFSMSNVLIQSSVNSFGEMAVAGNTAASNIEGFVYMAMNASYQSCVSFTGQNYGAGKPDRIIKTLFLCELTGIATGIILGWPAYFFGEQLLTIYGSSPEMIVYGMKRASVILTTYALCEVMDVPVGTLRGMGCGTVPMLISLVGACLFRVVWIFTIFQNYRTLETLYMSYPVSWILTATAQLIAVYVVFNRRFGKKSVA